VRYRTIPETPLNPSLLCLGLENHGTAIPVEVSWRLLDTFVELGGNFVDTAYVYAAWLPDGAGASERNLGAWLKSHGMRPQMVVATKGACADYPHGQTPRLHPEEITHDLLISLERLQLAEVDLYWLHRDDPQVPVGEILGVLNEHLAAGRVRAIGASNWRPARMQEAAQYARAQGLVGFCASQIRFSLAQANFPAGIRADTWSMNDETQAWHEETGVPVVAFSPQALGFFSGKYAADAPAPRGELAELYFSERNWGRLRRAQETAEIHGCKANEVALAYLLHQRFPVYPIIGCRTVEQLLASCSAVNVSLEPGELAYLREGDVPCGPAPH
jgi:aryl-alcohol dehydrogenase-like predicted oxidoreductase